MPVTHGDIGGAEPSTVTFKVDTVTINQNSTVCHREVLVIGSPQTSNALAAVVAALPASTEFGMAVRIVSGPSSAADLAMTASQGTNPWTIAGNSTLVFLPQYLSTAVAPPSNSTALNVRIVGGVSSAADFPVSVAGYSTIVSVAALPANSSQVEVRALPANSSQVEVRNTVTIQGNSSAVQSGTWTVNIGTHIQSSGAPSSGSSGLVVRPVWDDRLTAKSTNAFSSTSFTVNSSAAGVRAYVTAYTITSTVAAATKVAFYDGSTMIWPIQLQAVSSGVSGANLSAYPYLFHGDQARALTLQTPSSVAGVRVGVSYYLAP